MIAYAANLATIVAIFAILAATLNFIVGYAGIFSVAHAVFFGLGAYAGAQVALLLIPDPLLACLAGAVVAGGLSLCLALPALRVRGEYFVAASMGLQMMAVTLFSEAKPLTGGIGGLVNIPRPTLFGVEVSVLPLALVALALILLATALLQRGAFGRTLQALRDAESAAEALGKNVAAAKTLAMAFACAGAGIGGALFALHLSFVNVESFTMDQSVLVMAMVIIGGTGTLWGPLVGAIILLSLPSGLAFIPFIPPTEVGAVQQIVYGLAMTLLMIFRPAGLVGDLSKGRATA
ncbi:branched-chain amino acid ABC transporter permease [Roseomonas terrae]|jgi:branched-chain amino acid transport system permease protein|uniref:Branched-chain amino acid ABC transporter permease n=1 Tax=Neoroseomonas terrae TaxID=424799 RepID=A0ABS5EFS3_9PROT|nr:branched-chain amino acid ABC transporter permease [Neoroseomonas terrae]MBR0649820.1 branched-chain amino acid ABC transporter permease [Neoroseomonas terrae]